MKQELSHINQIPVILYGESCNKVFLVIHGKGGNKEESARLASFACERGYQVLSIDLPGYGARKDEIDNFVPWKVVPELQIVLNYTKQKWSKVSLFATSFGAFCSLLAFQNEMFETAMLVSPVLNMTRLIQNMMLWANVTEEELKEKRIIPTSFGETLDWNYYQYVLTHPIEKWNHPTKILYAGTDTLTDRTTVDEFVKSHNCSLTVMEDGEHWFHTPKQLAILDKWIIHNI